MTRALLTSGRRSPTWSVVLVASVLVTLAVAVYPPSWLAVTEVRIAAGIGLDLVFTILIVAILGVRSSWLPLERTARMTRGTQREQAEVAAEAAEASTPARVVVEALSRIPDRGVRRTIVRRFVAESYGGRAPGPFAKKMAAHHIDKLIQLDADTMRLEFADRASSRRWVVLRFALLLMAVVIVALVVALVLALNGHDDLLTRALPYLVTAGGGFGGGYGFSEWRRRRD